ncbi:MAG: TetR/AcrR family transcriptional regulator [Woeseiaceae bacterium]|nr:TetR/AcrR family transcriptional regulator [Woeseiaceae bacterium]
MPRTPEYDRDAVIHEATAVFWERGYSQTSVGDLVEATGLKPGSLYAAFGSKKGVFLEVLDDYNRRFLGKIRALAEGSIIDGVQQLLDEVIDEVAAGDASRGCLSVNTLIEMSQHDAEIAEHLATHNRKLKYAFADLFGAAQRAGEISDAKDPRALASFLINNLWGMRVTCKSGPDRRSLEAVADTIMTVLATDLYD